MNVNGNGTGDAASPDRRHHPAAAPLPPWRLLLATFAGGLMGSALRAGVRAAFDAMALPAWGAHLAVNVAGAFAAGWFFARIAAVDAAGRPIGVPHVHRMREHLWSVGFLGGLTTVSGFAWDAAQAASDGQVGPLAAILAVNAVVGIACAAAGWKIGQ